MAVARRDGGIYWADAIGLEQGILLWDSREACTAWAEREYGLPAIVVEIDRRDLDFDYLEPVRLAADQDHRTYCYRDAIEFGTVRWYKIQQQWELLGHEGPDPTLDILAQAAPVPAPEIKGVFKIDI